MARAAPIQRAIMDGDDETGVCIMKMNEGLDTGPILSSAKLKFWIMTRQKFYRKS